MDLGSDVVTAGNKPLEYRYTPEISNGMQTQVSCLPERDNTGRKEKMEKYNELFKTLVAAGLLMPSAAGARWFGQVIAKLNREKPGWDQ